LIFESALYKYIQNKLKIHKWTNFTRLRIKAPLKSLKKTKRAQLPDSKMTKNKMLIKRKNINRKLKRIIKKKKNFKTKKNHLINKMETNKNSK
jgi:hypothetical protein